MMSEYKNTEQETRDLITANNMFEFTGDPEPFTWCTRINGITCAEPHTRATVKKVKTADLIEERNAVDEVIYDVEYIFNDSVTIFNHHCCVKLALGRHVLCLLLITTQAWFCQN